MNFSIRQFTTPIVLLVLNTTMLNLVSCSDSLEKIKVTGVNVTAKSSVVINANICFGCADEYCKTLCPQKAVSKKQIKNRTILIIDPELCSKCGICIETCPFGAITWKH